MDGTLALASAGAAMATSLGANSWLARVALRRGWCDRPAGVESGESRVAGSCVLKTHTKPIPFVGGLGVMLALAAAVGLSAIAGQGVNWGLVAAGLPALVLGTWDDLRWKTMSVPIPKLAFQIAAALSAAGALWLSGVRVLPGLPLAGLALAAAYVLGAVNAVNLEDGMDGLAGGEAAISALGFGSALWLLGRADNALAGIALAAALAGFLLLNWHPARLFLGDGGSHLVGALLAALALAVLSSAGLRALPATVLIVGLPVLGTLWVMARRLFAGDGLMAGDRSHLYDILHRQGLSVRQTVGVCWAIQAALVVAGVVWAVRG